MNQEQRKAYEWAKNQDYPSVAARYAKILAGLVDEMARPNEPLTLDKKRVIAESCLHYSKSGCCTLQGYAPLDCPRCKEWHSNESNEALALEQLREMGGQPVWVKVIGKTGISCDGWCEVEIREKDPFAYVWWPGSEVEDIAKIEDYGKTWACYAYPPANIHREVWVSVEERLPEDEKDGETVLVIVFGKPHENITLHGAIMTAGYFRDEGWILNEYPEWEGPEVTHWMPLPSPPAELEKRLRGVRA